LPDVAVANKTNQECKWVREAIAKIIATADGGLLERLGAAKTTLALELSQGVVVFDDRLLFFKKISLSQSTSCC
jgi:hypothetical protein